MTLEESIKHCKEVAENKRFIAESIPVEGEYDKREIAECLDCAEEHEQLAQWLRELKGLRLLLDWATECGFGYDNIPEEYERYKDKVEKLGYRDGLIYIATQEADRLEDPYQRAKDECIPIGN